jgi:ATP-dependent DNA ligase
MSGCTKSSWTASGVVARKDSERVRLYSRPGNNLTERLPSLAEAIAKLRSRSCISVLADVVRERPNGRPDSSDCADDH